MAQHGRRDERQPIALKIRFKTATLNAFIEQYSRDVSRGGIFIKMKSPMPVGTLIKFDFRLQDEKSLIQGVGRVVWRRDDDEGPDSPPGMGIKFIKLDDTSQSNLETIVRAKTLDLGEGGEEPVIEPHKPLSSKPPQPIAPSRPQVVPKTFKRTVMGWASATPESPTGEQRSSQAPGGEGIAPKSDPPPSTPPPSDPPTDLQPEPVDAPADKPDENFADEPKVQIGDRNLLVDISSAIDTALGTPDADRETTPADRDAPPAAQEPAVQEPAVQEPAVQEPAAQKPAADSKPPISISSDSTKPHRPSDDDVTKKTDVAEAAAVTPAAAKVVGVGDKVASESRGLPKTVWILAVIVVGVLVWYFGFRTTGDPESKSSQGEDPSTSPQPEKVASAEKATTAPPTADEPKAIPVKTTELLVRTEPTGAQVLIDGAVQEEYTPVTVRELPIGKEVEVQAKLFGYHSHSQKLLVAEKPIPLDFTLKPAQFSIEITSEPPGAPVIIDGKWWGRTPKRSTVKKPMSPRFSYAVTKAGYEDHNGKVIEDDWVESNGVFRIKLDVALKKKERVPVGSTRATKANMDRIREKIGELKFEEPRLEQPPVPIGTKTTKPPVSPPDPKPPAVEKPATEKPPAEKPTAEKPAAEKPTGQPKPEQPKPDTPKPEQPKADKPAETPPTPAPKPKKPKADIDENPF